MLVDVEIRSDVIWCVEHRCDGRDRTEFYERIQAIQREPIMNSEAVADAKLSRYLLRFFRFGNWMAIFKYDPSRNKIWVKACSSLKQK